ncbi:hypothetical protein MOF33_15565 [Bacillus spizizenii]|nr:hypothetical protein [Bacillus spizizenii]
MGTWDLDGDGSNEMAYNLGQHLEIQSLSGPSFTYKIGASWGLNQVTDTDGDGVTDLVSLAVDGGKQGVKVLHHKTHNLRFYQVLGSPSIGLYKDTPGVDLDGIPGSELIIKKQNLLIVIHDRDASMYQYNLGADNWGIHSISIADFNAEPGKEILVKRPKGVTVILDRVKTGTNM